MTVLVAIDSQLMLRVWALLAYFDSEERLFSIEC